MQYVKERSKVYNNSPQSYKFRVQGRLSEKGPRCIHLNPDILDCLKGFKKEKEEKNKEYLRKARSGEDGTFLTIGLDTHIGVCLRPARRLNAYEKKVYTDCADYVKQHLLVGLGDAVKLPHIKLAELPNRETDGFFEVIGSSVWIITAEEYDNYKAINNARENEKKSSN